MVKEDFSDEHRVKIYGKNIEVTKTLKDYIQEKIAKIERFTDQIIDINVRLDVQKLNHFIDVVIKFSHFKIFTHASTTDMYASIDKAFERLKRKMGRWKDRIKDHHAKGVPVTEMQVNILENTLPVEDELSAEIIEENNESLEKLHFSLSEVVKTKKRSLKTLTLHEAIMKIELSGDSFLLFRNEEDRTLHVLYRRRDGSFGVMIPE